MYYQNTYSVVSVTEPDSTCSLYDGHFSSNKKDSNVLMNISECLNNFSEVFDKAQRQKKKLDIYQKYFPILLTCN